MSDWIVEESHTDTRGEYHFGSPVYIVKNDPLAVEFDMHDKYKAEFVCRLLNAATDQTAKIAELNKLVEEAQAARAQDQQRLFHYEGTLLDKGLDPNKVSPDTPTFKKGDRVIYDLGHNGEVSAEVLRITKKRVFIRLIGRFGGVRYVGAKSLRPDPNPSPE